MKHVNNMFKRGYFKADNEKFSHVKDYKDITYEFLCEEKS